jgi:RHS repeat-associated protein
VPDLHKSFKNAVTQWVSDMQYYLCNDRLGSGTVVTNQNGGTEQVLAFQPWGEDYFEMSAGFETDFRFGGKIRDAESDMQYFEDRYRKYGDFITTDRLWFKKPWQSSYLFCSNDPINRADPDGKDDYSVDDSGKIKLEQKTEDKTDRLIALGKNNKIEYDDAGNMTNTSIEVKKGILNNQQKSKGITYLTVTSSNKVATNLFEFLSENTSVEWGRVAFGNSSNYISTKNDASENGIETIAFDKLFKTKNSHLINSIDHSHPNETMPSGFPGVNGFLPKGQGDKLFAEWLYNNYPLLAPSVVLRVYLPSQNKYIHYNNKKIITK